MSLYLFLILTGYDESVPRPILYVLLITPAIACIVLASIFVVQPSLFRPVTNGWVAVYDITSVWIWVYIFYYCSYFGTGLFLIIAWGMRSRLRRERRQARIIISTVIVSLLLSSIFDNLLPVLGIIRFPLIAPIAIMVWMLGTWYAIIKYRLMSLSTAIAADKVIARMQDLLLLSDYRGRILQMNRHACRLLGYEEKDAAGMTLGDIMAGEEDFIGENDSLSPVKEKEKSFEVNFRTVGGELIPVALSASEFRDPEGDLIGVAFVGHDLREAKKLEEMYKTAERDMRMAARVQEGLYPGKYPSAGGWDISHVFAPAAMVSGDFYDFYERNGRFSGVGLFDVSGHGISSGLITIIARSIVDRAYSSNYKEKLNRVMEIANRELIREIGNIDIYVTGIILRYSEADGFMEYVNAGHTDLIRKSGSTKKVTLVKPRDEDVKGLFLGVKEMEDAYRQVKFSTSPGDQLLLYSDCLIEAVGPGGDQYGLDRLMETFSRAPEGQAKAVLDFITSDLRRFMDGKPLQDDLTVILLRRE